MRIEQVDDLMSQLGPVLDPLGISGVRRRQNVGHRARQRDVGSRRFRREARQARSEQRGRDADRGDRSQLYELMLRHNYLWDQTGGVRLALDAAGRQCGPDCRSPHRWARRFALLGRAVGVFAEAARAWREIIRRPAGLKGDAFDERGRRHSLDLRLVRSTDRRTSPMPGIQLNTQAPTLTEIQNPVLDRSGWQRPQYPLPGRARPLHQRQGFAGQRQEPSSASPPSLRLARRSAMTGVTQIKQAIDRQYGNGMADRVLQHISQHQGRDLAGGMKRSDLGLIRQTADESATRQAWTHLDPNIAPASRAAR